LANRIILLDENTANRIAAGEVVERPASAVKELVENAIDAGATQVVVSLEEGGKRRIEVADNGCGMGPEDAVLALQRHATSKIRSADDLFAIRTLGFRGEALPSIASVSHLTLTTKATEEDAGVRVVVRGGDVESVEPAGARDGTVVVVEDLFYNTPARLKFLKSTPTEFARAVEMVGHLAIAHPDVAFRVRHGGQEVFATPGGGDPMGALSAVWGREVARKLVRVRHDSMGLCVSGFLCTPDTTRPGRSHELFYVNRRPIRSRLLGHALEDAVRAFTPESRYPIAALFIDIEPDMVDVNVHPTKTEVKFTRDPEVHHAASQAVKEALLAHGIVPQMQWESRESRVESRESSAQRAFVGREFDALARAAADAFRPFTSLPEELPASTAVAWPSQPSSDEAPPSTPASGLPTPRPFAEQLRGFRVLGQARNTYIIAVTDEGIAFIDQHVAHERVLYERLTVKRAEQGISAQRLAVPFTLSVGAAEASLLSQRLADFASVGWEIEAFGRDSFLVRSVPSYVTKRSYESLLRDMVDELVHQSVARRLIVQRDHVTITNACKMAVKAGDPLTMEEMVGLLDQLADTENPYLCPHGRPIVVTVPFLEIDRKFKRA
jgi:DNA mismatch repair protein MutL